jgi:hypothetical protein
MAGGNGMTRVKTFAAGAVLALFVSGCGASTDDDSGARPYVEATPPAPDSETAQPFDPDDALPQTTAKPRFVLEGNGANVTRRRYGKAWPLTVPSGRVNCIPITAGSQKLVVATFVTDNGARYWLNGTAKARADDLGLRDIDTIWAEDPSVPGLKKTMVLIDVCTKYMKSLG